jgi:hypothetical protein
MVFKYFRWTLTICLILIPNSIFAAQLLDQIKSSMNTQSIARGKFIQNRTLTGVSKKLTSEGYFLVDKNRGILWVTEKPIYQILLVTDTGISIRNKSNALMTLNSRNNSSVKYVNDFMRAVFSGDMYSLDKIFNHSGEISSKGWVLDLIPKNTSSTIFKKVSISGDSVINHIIFTSAEGDITDIAFIDVMPATSLTKDEISQFQ